MTTRKKRLCFFVLSIGIIVFLAITLFLLYCYGVIQFNHPSLRQYPVRGVDVSEYQGTMNWPKLAEQNISFAFIKATEGSSYQDKRFTYNWTQAAKTKLKIGAYHFFSFESRGLTQAENFIQTVPDTPDTLPPVVDVELYGKFKRSPPDIEQVSTELTALLKKLEEHYQQKPILYATNAAYQKYIKSAFDDYDLWIRNVYSSPVKKHGNNWKFWQYSDKIRLEGYQGTEKFIDMNVFNGSSEEFEQYCNRNKPSFSSGVRFLLDIF